MTTLKEAFRKVAQLPGVGPMVVRALPIDSLTTTTVTVNALKRGEPASRYANWFLVRRDATSSADRVRQVSAFDGSTGVLTHAGANYGDTTATSETLELWAFDPEQLDQYAQQVLNMCRRMHRDIIPAHGGGEYYLDQYSWIQHAGHIQRLLYTGTPILSRNPYLRDWNVIASTGSFEPDRWIRAGGGSWARSTTNPFRGPYEVTCTRSSTDQTFRQFVGAGNDQDSRSLRWDGVDSFRGETVSLLLRGRTATASHLYGLIDDNVSPVNTDAHTGGGGQEALTVSMTVSDSATELSFGWQVKNTNAAANVSECVLVLGEITDAVKRDVYYGKMPVHFDWRDRPTSIIPNYLASRGTSYVLDSWRPYPLLDATRLLAGNADADESDIPVDLWAYGIAALLFEAQGDEWGDKARQFRGEFERLRGAHQWDLRPSRLHRRPLGRPLRRA